MEKNRIGKNQDLDDFFGDFQFNYAVVIFGTLSNLQSIKQLIEKQTGITIRYQTLDRGKLLIKRGEDEK